MTAVLAAGVATGCKDFLTEEPPLEQSTEITLSTYEGLNNATAGAYSRLASSGWYGGEFILLNELKTANGKKFVGSSYDTGRMNDWYNINYNANTTSSLFGNAYYVISQANNIIDNLTEDKGDAQDLNNLRAECLFLRALSYFDLVRTYGQPYTRDNGTSAGVPVVLHTDSDDQSPRSTVADVYSRIVSDLTEAESIIDPAYRRSGGTDAKAWASVDAIRALLSRVYLYMGQWQNAADYATLVIESGNYTLWSADALSSTEAGINPYMTDATSEVIFEICGLNTNSYDPGLDGLWAMTAGSYGDAGCASDVRDLFEESDVRGGLFVHDPKNAGEDVWHTSKYRGKGIGSSVDYTNVMILRLSEMYLNRAEALVNGAAVQGCTATADLQTIADARGAAVQPATRDGVFTERWKELNWEGHLWFDLGRTGRDMTRTDVANSTVPSSVSFSSEPNVWAMPIPLSELEVNPNLTQNPGY